MATGDSGDQLSRLQKLIPEQWPGDDDTLWTALLAAFSAIAAWLYIVVQYAITQTRIKTATGGFLDAISADFLGDTLPRNPDEADDSYRTRILLALFRERATRPAMRKVLFDLTGRYPRILEPARIADTGAYGGPLIGYGVAGAYGSLRMPFECFIDVFRPIDVGVPRLSAYNISAGGYGQASSLAYASREQALSGITDSAILDAINMTRPIATICWTRIINDTGTETFPEGGLVDAIPGFPLAVAGTPIALAQRLIAIN